MSDYAFKNLSDVETVAEPAEDITIMGFQSGTPIQMPMSAIKASPSGGSESNVFVIDPDDPEYSTTDPAYGDKIKKALLAGKPVWLYDNMPTGDGYPSSGTKGYYSMAHFAPNCTIDSQSGRLYIYFDTMDSNTPKRKFDFAITT